MQVRSSGERARSARAILGVLGAMIALAGCSKVDAAKSDPPGTPDASKPSAPTVAIAPDAAFALDPSALSGALRGTIDGKHAVVMHLVRNANAIAGSYYYVPSIDDLALRGSVTSAGAVHLDETVDGKPTGAFDGRVDASGALDGTWSDVKRLRHLPFRVTPVRTPASAPAILVERKRALKSKPTLPFDPAAWGTDPFCELDVVFPDVVGAIASAAAEIKVGKDLKDGAVGSVRPCEQPYQIGAEYTVRANEAGVLSVEQPTNDFVYGMPHPNYGTTFTNLSLPSGKPIALGDILTPAGIALVESRILASLSADVDPATKTMIQDALGASPPDFSLERAGLRVSVFNQLPHAYKGAGANGLPIAARDLAAVRVKPSPVDALW